jgi:uncharacterized protein (DUF2147 family)
VTFVNAQALSRRDDIDWLRIGATYLLFVFHGAMVFNPAPFYHIRNADLSLVMLVLCGFIALWHMPLFFLLAGWSTQASLAVRGTRGYLRERVQKLLIPLLAGVALFGPIIKFIELKSGLDLSHTGLRVSAELQESFRMVIPSGLGVAPPFHDTFFDFLPTFFTRLDRFTWSHLWFVAYLFTFSLLYLPLISWLGHRAPRLKQPGVIWAYAPALPLAVIQLTLRERWPGIQNLYNDWANFGYYSVYLLAGVVLGSQPALERVVHQEWKRALLIGVSVSGILLLALLRVFTAPWVVLAGSALAGWCFVIALLGLGRAFLSSARLGLGYLRQSAFPVYILHQVAIVLSGYAIIQLPLGIGAKFALIVAASVTSTLAVYHFVVRRSAAVGVLYGVKPKACPLPARGSAVAAAGAVLLLVVGGGALASPESPTPIGVWYAEGGAAKVDIHPCGASLCGDVVWLRSPWDEDGCEMRDRYNPEVSLRDRPLVGLQILTGLARAPSADGVFADGSIYDPASGRTYRCQAQLDGPDRLELRGYVGIPLIGRTTRWVREGTEGLMCQEQTKALHAATASVDR